MRNLSAFIQRRHTISTDSSSRIVTIFYSGPSSTNLAQRQGRRWRRVRSSQVSPAGAGVHMRSGLRPPGAAPFLLPLEFLLPAGVLRRLNGRKRALRVVPLLFVHLQGVQRPAPQLLAPHPGAVVLVRRRDNRAHLEMLGVPLVVGALHTGWLALQAVRCAREGAWIRPAGTPCSASSG